jgi:serine/threonine-protein kinase
MSLTQAEIDAYRGQLREFVQVYRREERAMSYRDLCARQSPPWASIAYGAAGIAAALSAKRLCTARERGRCEFWLAAARRGAGRYGLNGPELPAKGLDHALYHGRDGIDWLRLLVGSARGSGQRGGGLRAFLVRCRHQRGGPTELLFGIAGYLNGLVLLYRARGNRRVLEVADELARDLLDRQGGRHGWGRAKVLGFAHGRAGIFHALLGWSDASGRELPRSFFDQLERFAEEVEGRSFVPADAFAGVIERSWCNGTAGLVLLWARAYEHTPGAAQLNRARRAARSLFTHAARAPGSLCCGLTGRAYALLAMDRIEPGRGWYGRALGMGGRALGAMIAGVGNWPNGLFYGYPGLVCLAADLLGPARDRGGFPLVEGYGSIAARLARA